MDFEEFNMDRILNTIEDSSGFILSSVFSEKIFIGCKSKASRRYENLA